MNPRLSLCFFVVLILLALLSIPSVQAQTGPILPAPLLYPAEDAAGLTQVWMVQGDGSSPQQVTHENDGVRSFTISNQGDMIAFDVVHTSGGEELETCPSTFNIYELDTWSLIFQAENTISCRGKTTYRFLDGDRIIAVSEREALSFYRLPQGDLLYRTDEPFSIRSTSGTAVVMTRGDSVSVLDLRRGEIVYEATAGLTGPTEGPGILRPLEVGFSPDGSMLGVSANGLHILNTETWEEIPIPALEETTLQSAGFLWDDNGQYFVYEDHFNLYRLDLQSFERVTLLESGQDCDFCGELYAPISLSPNGDMLLFQAGGYEYLGIMVLAIGTGEIVFEDSGDAVPGWRPGDGATLAMNSWPIYGYLSSRLFICDFTLSVPCQMLEYGEDEVVRALQWTAVGNLTLQSNRFPASSQGTTRIISMTWPGQQSSDIFCGTDMSARGFAYTSTEDRTAIAFRIEDDLCVVNLFRQEATLLGADFEYQFTGSDYWDNSFTEVHWLPQ